MPIFDRLSIYNAKETKTLRIITLFWYKYEKVLLSAFLAVGYPLTATTHSCF